MLSAISTKQMVMKVGFAGELRFNEPMSNHTSWRVGGPAERFYIPKDKDDLALFIASLDIDEPIYWVGLGSNLLVRDGGIRGTVISPVRLKTMKRIEDSRLYVEAGVLCPHVARFASVENLVGAEFFVGIPGSVGGAMAMNAGAFGGETWNLIERVTTVNRSGKYRRRTASEYKVGYREVSGPDGEWFVSAEMRLNPFDSGESQAKFKQLLARRSKTQPIGSSSCGSVFRNPEDDYAARLIESIGIKGVRIGGAEVSEKHANFILNTGNASAADIESLIQHVVDSVDQRQGIKLHPEVRIVGEKAEALQ